MTQIFRFLSPLSSTYSTRTLSFVVASFPLLPYFHARHRPSFPPSLPPPPRHTLCFWVAVLSFLIFTPAFIPPVLPSAFLLLFHRTKTGGSKITHGNTLLLITPSSLSFPLPLALALLLPQQQQQLWQQQQQHSSAKTREGGREGHSTAPVSFHPSLSLLP